ncbi:VOC family protein [Solirubrobacter soli]|uniref:VOC family protein n=1 Tax=Solirubrobacter soli TaxID=363832 RepID=UPI0003FD81F1|nr:VOC family protein [Solirubrobacter soli]
MAHPIVWFEVIGKDAEALSRFYGDLFDWKMDAVPGGYYMATPEGAERPTGGVGADPSGGAGHVTFYAQCDDLQAMLDKASSLGGTTIMPPSEPMEGTTIALFADPEGHVVGLVKSDNG